MAAPTFAEIMGFFARVLDLSDEIEKFADAAATGYVAMESAAIQDLETDYVAGIAGGLDAKRAALAAACETIRGPCNYVLLEVAKAIDSQAEGLTEIWRDLYDYMYDNGDYVNSREFSFGTPSADGGNVGNGEMLRVTNDDRGMPTEGWQSDVYTAECVRDARQIGVSYEEEFRVRGTAATKDELARTGTGLDVALRCVSERTSERYVLNPGFETYGGTTPTAGTDKQPTSLSGWTPASGGFTNVKVSVDQLYRTPPGSSTSISLHVEDNETISQDLVDIRGTRIDKDTPYHVALAVYRAANCDGNLVLTLGGVTRTVAMSTLNNGAWNVVHLVATAGASNWYEAIKENDLTLSIQLTGRTTGTTYWDAIIFAPFALLGGGDSVGRGAMGTWAILVAGATPYVAGDEFTITDTEGGTRAVNQYWCAIAGYGYLPSTSAGYETIADL